MQRSRATWFWPLYLGAVLCVYAQKPPSSDIRNIRIETRQSVQPGGAFVVKVLLSWDRNSSIGEYFVESSTDCVHWEPAGSFTSADLGDPAPDGRYIVEIDNTTAACKFYRMYGTVVSPAPAPAKAVPLNITPVFAAPLTTVPLAAPW
jgi:hypothetical protein